jgi:cyclopropane fatty-acyl-phospholipid synthase-like methyltransferase
LPQGSHVLDFGATENTLALSLASMGHHVDAVDLRPYPLEHPRLTKVICPVEEWEGSERPFDAIISLSTLEHVGLGHYGDSRSPHLDLDQAILERFRGWLRPGGLLILTAPYGRWSVDELQRTYDAKHLDALLRCWEVLDRRYAVSPDPLRWFVIHDDPLADGTRDMVTRGVVMLKATPAP